MRKAGRFLLFLKVFTPRPIALDGAVSLLPGLPKLYLEGRTIWSALRHISGGFPKFQKLPIFRTAQARSDALPISMVSAVKSELSIQPPFYDAGFR
jgi:hypothetical protein